MSSLNGMDLKCQEYGTLKVPYELLNKRFRVAQKTIDREISSVDKAFKQYESRCSDQEGKSKGEAITIINGVLEKLKTAKRKANDVIDGEESSAKLCKLRIEHLKKYASPNVTEANDWKNTRFYRMVVDHLLHCGFYTTAVKLAEECNITDLVNTEVFIQAWEVEQDLDKKKLESCLRWCKDNRSRLRRLKSNLEFSLHVQQFVELVRQDKQMQAVLHARKNFATIDQLNFPEVTKVMGLLVYNLNSPLPCHVDFLSEKRWKQIKEKFRYENYRLHQLGELSIFKVTLQAGLAGLKTHQCYDEKKKSLECPVCSPIFNKLALPLPFAHCAQSRIVCCITGELMNENNQPMMLPNGYVYGEHGLQKICSKGKVVCPRTNTQFNLSEAEKLFIM